MGGGAIIVFDGNTITNTTYTGGGLRLFHGVRQNKAAELGLGIERE